MLKKRARADIGLSTCPTGMAVNSENNGGGKNSMGYIDMGKSFPLQDPINGGIPPTSDPTHVLITLDHLRLVKTPAITSSTETELQNIGKTVSPTILVIIAKLVAWADEMAPWTSGLILVLVI